MCNSYSALLSECSHCAVLIEYSSLSLHGMSCSVRGAEYHPVSPTFSLHIASRAHSRLMVSEGLPMRCGSRACMQRKAKGSMEPERRGIGKASQRGSGMGQRSERERGGEGRTEGWRDRGSGGGREKYGRGQQTYRCALHSWI